MSAGMKVDVRALRDLAAAMESPALISEMEQLPARREIAALVGQAIADNFAQQGPGWEPLKGETIRRSVAKKVLKHHEKLVLSQMGFKSKQGVRKARRMAEFHEKVGGRLEAHEAQNKGTDRANRMILQRTGLLKMSATTPGGQHNIWRRDGVNLVWGTDLVYAGVHNYGNAERGIPQREFLVIREQWQQQLEEYAIQRAQAIIEQHLGGR
jgi:phage gpG-like protein